MSSLTGPKSGGLQRAPRPFARRRPLKAALTRRLSPKPEHRRSGRRPFGQNQSIPRDSLVRETSGCSFEKGIPTLISIALGTPPLFQYPNGL